MRGNGSGKHAGWTANCLVHATPAAGQLGKKLRIQSLRIFSLPPMCVCLLLAHATKSGCFSALLKKERVKTWSETQQGSLSASASAFPFALACCSFRFGFAFAFGLRRSFGLGVNGLLVHSFLGLSFLG